MSHWDRLELICGDKQPLAMPDNDTLKEITEAVDKYHDDRYDKGFDGREGRERRYRAESNLIKDVNRIFPYDEHRKRRD